MNSVTGMSVTDKVRQVVLESFEEHSDGFFYPMGGETPLVRVQAATGGWCVERRRNQDDPWMPIASGTISEFDPGSWRSWRIAFSMTV